MESNPFFAIACILDPRFSSSSKTVAAQQMLMEAYEKLQLSEPTTRIHVSEVESPPPAKRPRVNSSLLNCVQKMMKHSK